MLAIASAICLVAEPTNVEIVDLSAWQHEFHWEEFKLSKEAPGSDP
jgi:hypothetical protein